MSLFWWRREQMKRKSARRATAKAARPESKWRPRIEQLEDRVTPAVHIWLGGHAGDPSSWFDSNNWIGGAPTEGNADLIFPAGGFGTSTNDIPIANLTIHSIEIDGAPAALTGSNAFPNAYNINGNPITLNTKVGDAATGASAYIISNTGGVDTGAFASHIALNVILANSAPGTPQPVAREDISAVAGDQLFIDGAVSGGANTVLEINGSITANAATGLAAQASNKGAAFFTTANSYTSPTYIADGTLHLRNSASLGAADGTAATGTFLGSYTFGTAAGSPAGHTGGATPELSLDGGVSIGNERLEIDDASAPISLASIGVNSWAGPIVLNANTPTIFTGPQVPLPASTGSLTLTGPISQINGASGFVKTGPATLVLAGTAPNTFTGNVTATSGILNIQKSTALGAPGGTGFFGAGGTALTGTAILQIQQGAAGPVNVGAEDLTIFGPSGLHVENVSGSNTWNGEVNFFMTAPPPPPPPGATPEVTFSVDNAADTFTVNGVVSDLGAGQALDKTGPGTMVLGTNLADNTNPTADNLYSGGTVVVHGTLRGAKSDAFGPAGTVSVINDGVLQLQGTPRLFPTTAPFPATPFVLIPTPIDLNSSAAVPLENVSGFTDLTNASAIILHTNTSIASDAGKLFLGTGPAFAGDVGHGPVGAPGFIQISPVVLAVNPAATLNVTITRVTQGGGAVEYDGHNTYGGTTNVFGGELDLNAPTATVPPAPPPVIAPVGAIPKDLVIGTTSGAAGVNTGPGTVRFETPGFGTSEFASLTNPTTVNPASQIIVNAGDFGAVGPLTLNNGNVNVLFNAVAGAATFQLNGDVHVVGPGGSNILGTGGFVDLNGVTRTFNLDSGATLLVTPVISNFGAPAAGITLQGTDNTSLMTLGTGVTETYDGPTTINNGVLDVNSVDTVTNTTVNGGILGGTGTVGPVKVNPAGTIEPGSGLGNPGTLTADGPVNFDPSTFTTNLLGTSPAQIGELVVNGTANITNGQLVINAAGLAAPAGTKFVVLTASNLVGHFANAPEGGTVVATNGTKFTVNYVGNTVVLTLQATQAGISFGLTPSPNPQVFGQPVTLTVTVTAANSNPPPGGTITFEGPSGVLGVVPLVPASPPTTPNTSTATLVTSVLPVGTDTITAVYSGDSLNAASSASTTETVTKAPTTTTLGAIAGLTAGQSTTLVATISPSNINNTPASGTVTFTAVYTPTGSTTPQNLTLGTAPVANGVATLNTGPLAGGSYVITATYSGDNSYMGSPSTPQSVTVSTIGTTTTLGVLPSTVNVGQSVTLSAVVTGGTGAFAPTGMVQFLDGTTVLSTQTLTGGTASFTTSTLSIGSHTITAKYLGDVNNSSSTSASQTVTVNKFATSTNLNASPDQTGVGSPVNLTASVTGGGTGAFAPTGTVTFKDGANTIGTVALVNGSASLSTTSLAIGVHSITAVYSGDANNAGSTSLAASVTITSPVIPGAQFPQNSNITNLVEITRFKARRRPAHGDFVVPIKLHNISGQIIVAARAFFLGLPSSVKIEAPTFSGLSKGVPGVPDGTPFVELSEAINAGYTIFLHVRAPNANAAENAYGIQILAGA